GFVLNSAGRRAGVSSASSNSQMNSRSRRDTEGLRLLGTYRFLSRVPIEELVTTSRSVRSLPQPCVDFRAGMMPVLLVSDETQPAEIGRCRSPQRSDRGLKLRSELHQVAAARRRCRTRSSTSCQRETIWLALKIDEYVPEMIPMSSARAKLRTENPPNKNSASRGNTTVNEGATAAARG